jgi:hypothetical protein
MTALLRTIQLRESKNFPVSDRLEYDEYAENNKVGERISLAHSARAPCGSMVALLRTFQVVTSQR